MSQTIKPYSTNESKKQQVSKMFDKISREYDGLNRAITFGVDQLWRKKLIKMASKTNPDVVLDVASGTGDLAIMMARNTQADHIVGVDISKGMLEVAEDKIKTLKLDDRITTKLADSEDLPFEDQIFDVVTVAFGVRNFEHLEKGLQEIFRVLKPNGLFLILETSVPRYPIIKQLYLLHTNVMLPFLGKLFSKDAEAYKYLSRSAQKFPCGEVFNNILRKIGFINVKDYPQFFGASTIYAASK